MLKLRSSIKKELMKKHLFKGFFISLAGVLILLFCGMYLPLSQLRMWGLPLVITAFTLIGCGMIPYKRLSKLELTPHEIHCNAKDLIFFKRGYPLFKLQADRIDSIDFVNTADTYGISIQLKRPSAPCLTLLTGPRKFASFASDVKSKVPTADLFLPYFNDKSFNELQDFLKS